MAEPEPWTRIYNRIKAQIPAATDAVIRQEITAIVGDFTTDTNTWIEEVPITIVPDVRIYPFTVANGLPTRLMAVWRADDPSQVWADMGISMRVPGELRVFRTPTAPVDWIAAVAKTTSNPQMTTDPVPRDTGYPVVDSWIVEKFSDVIYFGAMHYLQRQPTKPYYNRAAAAENGALYTSKKSEARVNNQNANVFGAQTWRYPQGFSTITRKGWP